MEKVLIYFNIGRKKWEWELRLHVKLCEWLTVFGKWSAKRFPKIATWTDK